MDKRESTRVAFTDSLIELAETDRRVMLVCSDSALVIKANPFIQKYPERYVDVGIAEQNAVACAAGMAACGLKPFVATYAGFITMRACEQVRTFVAYPGLNVKFIGANGGLGAGEREGVTHQFFEDIGILRAIPGITIVAPADASQVRVAVKAVALTEGPAYIRIGSGRDPAVSQKLTPFELGRIRILKEYGHDVALFTYGFLINRTLEAAFLLNKEGIKTTVVETHTLKPLDVSGITQVLRKTRAAVTVEDHNIIGGLGSAVAEVIAENAPATLIRLGLQDRYPESGESEQLLDHYGMSIAAIVKAARKVLERKK